MHMGKMHIYAHGRMHAHGQDAYICTWEDACTCTHCVSLWWRPCLHKHTALAVLFDHGRCVAVIVRAEAHTVLR